MKKNRRSRKKENQRIIAGIFLVIVIVVMGAGMLAIKWTKGYEGNDEEGINAGDEVLTSVEEQIMLEEAYEIQTQYCSLFYPKKWEKQIEVEYIEEEIYIVRFYGKIEGKEKQHLFDIEFGDSVTEKLGIFTQGAKNIVVGYVFGETTIDDEWTVQEADTIYSMQDDINYLLGMLEKEKDYKAIDN